MKGYIGQAPMDDLFAETEYQFEVSTAQSVFSGLRYRPGYVDVYVNGSCLSDGVDYTALDGSTLTLTVATPSGETTHVKIKTRVPMKISDAMPTATLAAGSGANLVGYTQGGTGSVVRSLEGKLQESVSVLDFIPEGTNPSTTDCTGYISSALLETDTLIIPEGEYLTSGITISSSKTLIFTGGSFKSSSGSSRFATVTSGANLTLINAHITGYRLTNDSDKSNHGIVVSNGSITLLGECEISYFSGWGIILQAGGSSSVISKIGEGTYIHHNGGGIETSSYEYFNIDGASIISNGLNVANTDWSSIAGAGTGWGIRGEFANGIIQNCTINNNAIGVHLNSVAGANPDHGRITGNTINHNLAAGLIVENLHSYETVSHNSMLSNLTNPSAPSVTFSGTGASFDFIAINCIGLQVSFNNIGAGSGGAIPIYGHARGRYIGNNLVGVPFSELAHPQAGSKVYDLYGYNKNGDNLFFANMVRNEGASGLKAVILSDSVRTVITNEIESAGAGAGSGGGSLIDEVKTVLSLVNGWENIPGNQVAWVSRRSNMFVDIYIYVIPTIDIGSTITTLPAQYRPIGVNVQLQAASGNSLTHTYGTILADGTLTVVGATLNQPVLLNGTFCIN